MDDPERFRLEIMFSSGAQHNPYQHRPAMSHTMSISPREMLHKGKSCRTAPVRRVHLSIHA